jgi:3alpha(or 20beta)-hydroxysteroid dehydrogenase
MFSRKGGEDMGRLEGKVTVVTGAARGQGEATARLFAKEGAKVVLVDLLQDTITSVANDIGASALPLAMDISKEEDWKNLSDILIDKWGRVDVLINNAAVVHAADLLSLKRSDFERVLGINVIGSWLGIRTLAPHMIAQGSGSIVNIGSTASVIGMNGLGAYQTSKFALRGLTKTAAMELGFRGVRVNAIFPGGIDSPMAGVSNETKEEKNSRFVGNPIQRIGEPDEVAYTSLFLASDEASYLCGAEILVDGGAAVGKYYPWLPGSPPGLTE